MDYQGEALHQLSDTNTYSALSNDPGISICNIIKPTKDDGLQSGYILKRDHRFSYANTIGPLCYIYAPKSKRIKYRAWGALSYLAMTLCLNLYHNMLVSFFSHLFINYTFTSVIPLISSANWINSKSMCLTSYSPPWTLSPSTRKSDKRQQLMLLETHWLKEHLTTLLMNN